MLDVSVVVALAAGALSFLSPCVLPLVPAFLGALYGQVATSDETSVSPWSVLLHGAFFVLGFTVIFVALGAAATGIGQLLAAYRSVLTRVGGVVIIVFGLHTMGILRIPFLYYDTRRHYRPRPELGYLSSALMGLFFGAGWSPCIGVTLGAILTLALDQATIARGALLLFVYSLGLGIPFLILAYGVGRGAVKMRLSGRTMRVVTIVSGVFLIVLGVMMVTDTLGWFGQWAPTVELGA